MRLGSGCGGHTGREYITGLSTGGRWSQTGAMDGLGIAVATLPGPWGPVLVAATDLGVTAVDDGRDVDSFLAGLHRRFERSPADGPGARRCLDAILPLLEPLIAGTATEPGAIPIDLRDRPAFDRAVLVAVRDIPWGRTASYGEIARRIGAPRAARAVGGAVGRNPLAFLVPCHRVIASDGTIGGYGGSGPTEVRAAVERKRALLLREGVTVPERDG